MQGIEFTLKDGTKDCYDPIDMATDFTETDTHYELNLTYDYHIPKSEVVSRRIYELCHTCKREIYEDGCHYCTPNYGL